MSSVTPAIPPLLLLLDFIAVGSMTLYIVHSERDSCNNDDNKDNDNNKIIKNNNKHNNEKDIIYLF